MILLKLTGHFGRKMCVIVKCRRLFIYLFLLSNFICKKKKKNAICLAPFSSVPEHFYEIVFIEEM